MAPAEMCGSKNATTIHDIADGVKDGGGDGTQDLPSRMRSRTETVVVAPEPSHADGVKDSGGGGGCMFRVLPSWIGSRIVTTAGAPEPSHVDGVEDGCSRASYYRWWYAENDLEEGPDLQKAEELDRQVDMEMQKLALLVLQNYNAADRLSNRTFLDVVKSFCYIAHCSPETVDRHIFMVMFDNLIR
uniref:Uncharacterized protein n=1 Tax=Oryza rufipogon TaxID=4529 RepID=A0A0E0QPM9_ORYRU